MAAIDRHWPPKSRCLRISSNTQCIFSPCIRRAHAGSQTLWSRALWNRSGNRKWYKTGTKGWGGVHFALSCSYSYSYSPAYKMRQNETTREISFSRPRPQEALTKRAHGRVSFWKLLLSRWSSRSDKIRTKPDGSSEFRIHAAAFRVRTNPDKIRTSRRMLLSFSYLRAGQNYVRCPDQGA
jgi:hypothetical protein